MYCIIISSSAIFSHLNMIILVLFMTQLLIVLGHCQTLCMINALRSIFCWHSLTISFLVTAFFCVLVCGCVCACRQMTDVHVNDCIGTRDVRNRRHVNYMSTTLMSDGVLYQLAPNNDRASSRVIQLCKKRKFHLCWSSFL